jgi:hypothetical protein
MHRTCFVHSRWDVGDEGADYVEVDSIDFHSYQESHDPRGGFQLPELGCNLPQMDGCTQLPSVDMDTQPEPLLHNSILESAPRYDVSVCKENLAPHILSTRSASGGMLDAYDLVMVYNAAEGHNGHHGTHWTVAHVRCGMAGMAARAACRSAQSIHSAQFHGKDAGPVKVDEVCPFHQLNLHANYY